MEKLQINSMKLAGELITVYKQGTLLLTLSDKTVNKVTEIAN